MPNPLLDKYEHIYFEDRKAFRSWLAENHDTSPGIWLIYFKKGSGTLRLAYNDAVEEALCYGWIDSTAAPLDENRYLQLFTPRKAKSGWSRSNKLRVERLLAEKLIAPPGMAKIEAAKANGSWTMLDAVENLEMPPELKKALTRTKGALANFQSFTPGMQKQLLFWLNNAKREETRAKRIAAIVKGAAVRKNPLDS